MKLPLKLLVPTLLMGAVLIPLAILVMTGQQRVHDAVEQQAAAAQEISRNVQQAATGSDDVSANITGVNQSASQVGHIAVKVDAETGSLADRADFLRMQVTEFLGNVRAL